MQVFIVRAARMQQQCSSPLLSLSCTPVHIFIFQSATEFIFQWNVLSLSCSMSAFPMLAHCTWSASLVAEYYTRTQEPSTCSICAWAKFYCVCVRVCVLYGCTVCVCVWSGARLRLRVTGRALWRWPVLARALFTHTSNDSTKHRERRELYSRALQHTENIRLHATRSLSLHITPFCSNQW